MYIITHAKINTRLIFVIDSLPHVRNLSRRDVNNVHLNCKSTANSVLKVIVLVFVISGDRPSQTSLLYTISNLYRLEITYKFAICHIQSACCDLQTMANHEQFLQLYLWIKNRKEWWERKETLDSTQCRADRTTHIVRNFTSDSRMVFISMPE